MALAVPVALAMGLQSLYAIVDLAFVAQLGEEAVGGLAISLQAFFIILALSQAIATAVLADVSQDYGAGRVAQARATFSAYSIASVALGAVAALVAYASAEAYVDTFTDDPVVYDLGLGYFRVTALSFLLQIQSIVWGNGLRGSGDFTTPTRVVALSIAINAGLDPLLIFGVGPFPELGLEGAAWATVISQVVAVATYASLLGRRRADPRGMWWTRPAFTRALVERIAVRGLPAGVQFFLISVVLGMVLVAVKPFGALWTAVAGGGFRVMQQTFLPMVALGSAAGAISGQNLGAQRPERVRAAALTALRWAMVYGAAMTVLLMIGGRVAGRLFASGDEELDLAADYFLWSAPTVFAFALTYIPTFVLQAAGRAVLPLGAAVARVATLALALFAILPALGLDPLWVFGLSTAASFVEALLGVALLAWFLRRLASGP